MVSTPRAELTQKSSENLQVCYNVLYSRIVLNYTAHAELSGGACPHLVQRTSALAPHVDGKSFTQALSHLYENEVIDASRKRRNLPEIYRQKRFPSIHKAHGFKSCVFLEWKMRMQDLYYGSNI